MIYVLYALLGLLALYMFFILGPSVSMFFIVFSRKKGREPEELDPKSPVFGPYLDRLKRAAAFLRTMPSRQVELTAADGARLTADYYCTGRKTLVICAHGFRASPVTNFCVQARDLMEMGCDLLLVRQRAHPGSEGRRSSLGLLESEDLLRWVKWAEENTAAAHIVLYGISMGSEAIALASDRLGACPRLRGMILESCYSSPYQQMLNDCRKWRLPARWVVAVVRLCAKLILRADLKSSAAAALGRSAVPALFLHGTADTSVPLSEGRKCYAACGGEKDILIVENARHTLAYVAGGEEAKARVRAFIHSCTHSN